MKNFLRTAFIGICFIIVFSPTTKARFSYTATLRNDTAPAPRTPTQACTGSPGDPLFKETFGQAGSAAKPTLGPALAAGITTYTYYSPALFPGQSAGPEPGQYTISNTTNGYNNPYFANRGDHTSTDGTGYCMVVDANATPGKFYERTISGLCAGTTFEFSAWVMNINNQGADFASPSLRFDILDAGTHEVITSLSTGTVAADSSWTRLAGTFEVPAGASAVLLQVYSHTPSSRGNDLALDDIAFAPCGPPLALLQPDTVCSGADARLTASLPPNSYTSYYFQLQRRAAGAMDWTNAGPVVNNGASHEHTFTITGAQPGYEYRVLAASGATEIQFPNCRVASAPLELKVAAGFTVSIDNTAADTICHGSTAVLKATVSPAPGSDTAANGYVYTWETSADGSTGWTPIPRQTGPSLHTDTLTTDRYYRVTATINGCSGNSPSQPFKITLRPAASANAGPDQVQYNSGQFMMAATPPGARTGRWSVVSGAADIADPADPASTVTIAANTSATLRWTVVPDSSCTPASDDVLLTYTLQYGPEARKTAPATVTAGTGIRYTVTYVNKGPSDLTGALLSDTVPALVGNVTWTLTVAGAATADTTSGSGNIIRLHAALPAGEGNMVTLTINGTVSPDAAGTLTNSAWITPPGQPPLPSNSVSTTVSRISDLRLVKSGPQQAVAGLPVTYTLQVTNAGPANAMGIHIRDTVPAALRNVTWTATTNGNGTTVSAVSGSGNHIDLHGNLPASDTHRITIVITGLLAPGTTATQLRNTASALPPAGTTDPTPAISTVTTTVNLEADLVIIKTGPADKAAGQTIAYRLVITNNGPSDARGVTVQDVVPAAVTGFNFTPVATGAASITGSSREGNTIRLAGNLPAGDSNSIVLDISGMVSPDAAPGTVTNTATVTPPSGVRETMPSTNTSSISTNINTNTGLQISKSGPALANAGSAITYTIEVTNTGTTNAIGVILLDNVPADVTNVTWTAAAIGNGSTTVSKTGGTGNGINLTANIEGTTSGPGKIVLTINGTVALTADTAITNIASLEYAGTRQSSFTTAKNRSADLRIRKAGPAAISAGQRITYTLDVTNAGPAGASEVTITDTVPAQISAVSWTAAATGSATVHTSSGAGNVIALKAGLPAGKNDSIRVTVTGVVDPDYNGAITNTATAVPPPGNPDPTPAIGSVTTQADLHYDLQVLKAGPAQVAAGQQLTYTVTVTNKGPSNAANITISDLVPAQLQNVSWTAVASGNGSNLTGPASGSSHHIQLTGSLKAGPGHQVVLTITGTVNPAFTGTISNTATATAADGTVVSSSVSTLVSNSPGLEVVKSGPSNINAGQDIVYDIAVTNHGPSDARAISIHDVVPPQVQQVRWTAVASGPGARITGNSSGTGNDIVVNGDIAAGAGNRIDISINGRVEPSFTGSIYSTASVQAGSQPPVNSTPVVTVVSRKTGLLINKSAPTTARANDSITYTIRVSNAGPSNAVNALVTDQVANGVGNIRWTATATGKATISSGAAGTGPAVAVKANIPAGVDNGVIIIITGRISPGYSGLLKNSASVTPSTGPPVASDTSVTTVQRTADIRVVKSGPASVLPGGSITYTIDVSNTGPGDADTVTVTDMVPAVIAVHDWSVSSIGGNSIIHGPASGTGNQVRVQASLENGAQIRIRINGAVLPGTTGLVHNMAQAVLPPGTTDPSPDDTSSVTTEIPFIAGPPSANLVVEKQVLSNAPYRIGQRVDYRITLRNEGPDTATGVQVTDIFPAALGTPTPVLADKGQAQFDTASRSLQWSIGALPAGDHASLTYHVQLTGDGNVRNRAAVSGLETDPDTTSNLSEISIPVTGDIFIPNVITPNGDGLNDRLLVPGLEKYPGSLLDIYNRWGNQVYHTNHYSNNWEGAGLAEGTYYYILQVKKPEGVKVYKGWIQLLR